MNGPRLKSFGRTDKGRQRENNEDRFHDDAERGIFIVIDGVGGQASGEKAADTALSTLRARLERPTGSPVERVNEAITLANNEIFRLSEVREEWRGMACVLTVAIVDDGQITIGHVGDTRLYEVHGGRIQKVTHDHSPVGEREDSGELSELEAMRHPRRNAVFRDVGSEPHNPDDPEFIEIIQTAFKPKSALLMCSDGLSDLVPSARMLRIVEEHAASPWEVAGCLIEAANEAGGKDNITVVFVADEGFVEASPRDSGIHTLTARTPSAPPPEKPVAKSPPQSKLVWALRSKPALLVYGALLPLLLLTVFPSFRERLWGGNSAIVAPLPTSKARRLFVRGSNDNKLATIREALAQAQPGDVIEVAAGEYRELVSLKEGVTLVSAQPNAALILAPEEQNEFRIAVIADHITSGRLLGFKILGRQTHPLDIGIQLIDSTVEVEQTEVSGAGIAGIEISGRGVSTLYANRIQNNAGVGVRIRPEATPNLFNNLIIGNGKAGEGSAKPGIELLEGAAPVLVGNVIAENGAEGINGVKADQKDEIEKRNYFGGDVKSNKKEKTSVREARRSSP